jgi:hypothetical protein
MSADFPVTRRLLIVVEGWFVPLARPFLPPKKTRTKGGGFGNFYWDFEEHSAKTAMIGKAVRIISGLRAAMILADQGYVTECNTILRMTDDLVVEIGFLIDGLESKVPSKSYEEFVKQYFAFMPTSSDEYAQQAKVRWVSRDKVLAGYLRSIQGIARNPEQVRKSMQFIYYTHDKYVHGGYLTAMELYSGETNQFMLRGHDGDAARELAKWMVASGLLHALSTFTKVASLLGNNDAARNLSGGGNDLLDSGELP